MVQINIAKGPEWDAELKKLNATPDAIYRALQKEMVRLASDTRNTAIRIMRKTPRITRYKTGLNRRAGKAVTYNWMSGGKVHIPSSPGYPPATDTGDLVRSIKMDVRGRRGIQFGFLNNFEVEVGSNINKPRYPRWLEEGTKFMDARPWLEPALEQSKREFYVNVRRNVNEAIRRAR